MRQDALQPPVQKNQTIEIEIADLGNQGEGIGRYEDFTVFVEGALPGERVRVLMVKVKRRYGYAKASQDPSTIKRAGCAAVSAGGALWWLPAVPPVL